MTNIKIPCNDETLDTAIEIAKDILATKDVRWEILND